MYQTPDIKEYKRLTKFDRATENVKTGNGNKIIRINKERELVFLALAEAVGVVDFNIKRNIQQKADRRLKRIKI